MSNTTIPFESIMNFNNNNQYHGQQPQQHRARSCTRRCRTRDSTSSSSYRDWKMPSLVLIAAFCSTASSFHQSSFSTTTPPAPSASFRSTQPHSKQHTSSEIFASTIVPHPNNRNQHLEFWKNYLGLATPSFTSSSCNGAIPCPSPSFYYAPDVPHQQQQQKKSIEVQKTPDWVPGVFSSSSAATLPFPFGNEVISSSTSQTDLSPEDVEYLERKERWAAKYTSVRALRNTFGTNRNKWWGDLDAKTTRRLYKTLLPRALLELHCSAVNAGGNCPASLHPEDLAPLAYQARVAAKMYARERCQLPARIAANLYDGFRQWKRYGSFNCKGMSYQQLWEKYASVILHDVHKNKDDLTVEDVTAKICLKILERSCQTNAMVDSLVNCKEICTCPDDEDIEDLRFVMAQLEADARSLLQPFDGSDDCAGSIHEFTSSALLLDDPIDAQTAQLVEPVQVGAPLSSSSVPFTTRQQQRRLRDEREFQQHKMRLLRSILRLKRRFEQFQQQQPSKRQS